MNVTGPANKLYDAALRVSQPLPQGLGTSAENDVPSFAETIAAAAEKTMSTIAAGEQAAKEGVAGRAEPHSVVEALAQTEMALEMAVTVRDKVVEAYQEILRMPV